MRAVVYQKMLKYTDFVGLPCDLVAPVLQLAAFNAFNKVSIETSQF